jgi:hypothetical protein
LLSLENLEYLNLSNTALTSPHGGVPEFLGSFKNLTHLDLSSTYFTGIVPPQFGNLSKLEYISTFLLVVVVVGDILNRHLMVDPSTSIGASRYEFH